MKATTTITILAFALLQDQGTSQDVHTRFRTIGPGTNVESYSHLHIQLNIDGVLRNRQRARHHLTHDLPRWIKKHSDKNLHSDAVAEMTQNLLDIFNLDNHKEQALATLIGHTEDERTRRGLLAGALGLLGIGLSAWNTAELEQLKNRLHAQDDINQEVVHSLEETRHRIHANEAAISEMQDKVSQSLKLLFLRSTYHFNLERIKEKAEVEVQKQSHALGDTHAAVVAVLSGRFPPTLIPPHELKRGFEELRRKTEKRGYRLLDDRVAGLFLAEVSSLIKEGKLEIFIHVAAAPVRPQMTLYKYIPTSSLVNGKQVAVTSTTSYVLASDDLHETRELTDEEFARCRVNNGFFRCLEEVSTTDGTGCLTSLLRNDAKAAGRDCTTVFRTPPREEVTRGEGNTFHVFSPEGGRASLTCPSSPRILKKLIPGDNKIIVEEDCTLTTGRKKITMPRNLDTENIQAKALESTDPVA